MSNGQPTSLSITVTLQDVYNTLCPSCKEHFLEWLATRAKGPPVKEALRTAFEKPVTDARCKEARDVPI